MFSKVIVLLSFSSSLALVAKVSDRTKHLFLNDEPCMVRSTFIDFNPVELKCYPFMIILNRCTGTCNLLCSKIRVKYVFQKKQKT